MVKGKCVEDQYENVQFINDAPIKGPIKSALY